MYRFLILIVVAGVAAECAAQTARSAHFRVIYPRTVDARDADYVLNLLEHNRAELLERVSNAGIDARLPNLDLVFNASTGDFVARTGMPSWAAAATHKNKIELQPLPSLKQRRILESTLRHELAHAVIDTLGANPRWLVEGMAIYLAGEGKLLEPYRSNASIDTIEHQLTSPKSSADMRTAYANAYTLVHELIRTHGENALWKRLAQRS